MVESAYTPRVYSKDYVLEIFILAGMYTATLEMHLRAFVPSFGSAGWVIQALQSCRVLRLASVLGSHSSQMRKVYYTVAVSFPQMMTLVLCMMVVFHCFSVFARQLCGGLPLDQVYINEEDNFDTSVSSMRVLFQIATGQSFHGFITECQQDSTYPALVTPFFSSFFVVGNFFFVSLFVALLLDNLELIASDDFAVSHAPESGPLCAVSVHPSSPPPTILSATRTGK